jgi:hypothetical protein
VAVSAAPAESAQGPPTGGGSLASEPAIAVYVERKASNAVVDDVARVPPEYDGVPTDVIETGPLLPQTGRGRYRPAQAGVSVAHYASTAGTFGFLAKRDGGLYGSDPWH